MKNLMILVVLALATACSATDPQDIDPTLEVRPNTTEKIKEAQDVNIELEEIDGELDSLIINVK